MLETNGCACSSTEQPRLPFLLPRSNLLVPSLSLLRPASVGMCKRWANVYWSSTALWHHITVSPKELDQPIVVSP